MKLLLTFFLFFTFSIFSQNISMNNGSSTQCSGNFYDSGGNGNGNGANYGNNENLIYTICPNSTALVSLNFTSFTMEDYDYLYVFDGPNTSAPSLGTYNGLVPLTGTVQATSSNASGCLTFQFISDGSVNYAGWAAAISCVSPCQQVQAAVTAAPAPVGGIVKVCQGDNVTFTGSGNYPQNWTYYTQSDATSTYEWTIVGPGGASTVSTQNTTQTFATEGGYHVNLEVTDVNGCVSTNSQEVIVEASTTPIFDGTAATLPTICLGETNTLPGIVTPVNYTEDCTPPVGGQVYLPDGTGTSYSNSVTVACYGSGEAVTNANQIASICMNMEHSYIGDLDITITCPTGQTITLLDYVSGDNTSGQFLGTPVDDDNTPTVAGTGANYCFTSSATETMNDACLTILGGNMLPATNYLPVQAFSGLVGCEFNGDWSITITDNLGSDNGYIFGWSVDFANVTPSNQLSFTPTVVTEGWQADPTITSTSGNTITVQPTATGNPCYTYEMTDDFGCTYDTTVCFAVTPPGTTPTFNAIPNVCQFATAPTLPTTSTNGITGSWDATVSTATAGTFTFTFTPDPGQCASVVTLDVTVDPVPTTDAVSDITVCSGGTVAAAAYTSTPTGSTFTWTNDNTAIGLAASGSGNAPSFTATNATSSAISGTIEVTPTLGTCLGTSTTYTITVNPLPVVDAISDITQCAGTAIPASSYSSTPTGATFTWTNDNTATGLAASGSGDITSFTGTNATASPIVSTVSVTPTIGTCVGAPLDYTITINPGPSTTAGATTPICEGTDLDLTAANTGVAGTTFSWAGPNSFSSTTQNPTITAATTAATGTYTVTVSAAGCSSTSDIAVIVNPIPTTTASVNTPICEGNDLVFGATDPGIGGETYSWTGPNGFTSTDQNPTITAATTAASGAFTVVVSIGTCSSSDIVNATVNPGPITVAGATTPICEGTDLDLTASDPGIGGETYAWTGPNSFTSTAQNPTITAATTAATGTYTVTVSAAGCSSSSDIAVVVNPIPTTTASVNTPICEGNDLVFGATDPGIGGETYSWTGPNGFTSTDQSPTITAATTAASGAYTVVVSIGTCSSSDIVNATVNPGPITVAGATTPICEGTDLDLTASDPGIGGETYSWAGPNSFTSTAQNPTITAATTAATGTYTVTVSAAGCSSTSDIAVVVNAAPTTTAGSNTPICDGDDLLLTASSTSGTETYAWTGPNGFTSTLQNPTITGATTAADGNYIVTISENGCSSTDNTTVVVNAIPVTVASSNSAICPGDDLLLTATSTTGTETYSWTGPNGFTSTLQNPTISAATAAADGNYVVSITDNGCTSNDNTTVIINAIPTTIAGSNSAICPGDDLLLTATSTTGTETYSWTGPNGFTSTNQNPTITAATAAADGNYVVTITDNGCSSTDNTTVVISPIPTTIAGSNSAICAGEDLLLTASSTTGTETYSWTGPNGFTSTDQNPTITAATTAADGNYIVTVTENGCSSTDNTTVVINAQPTTVAGSNSAICEGDDLFITASSTTGTETYSWTGPNSFTSTNQNPSILAATSAASGIYSVTITDNGCTFTTTTDVTVISITSASASSNTPVCVGDDLELYTPTVGGATYSWTGPNGFTSTDQNPIISPASLLEAGTYSLTMSAAGCSATATTDVVINVIPTTIAGSNTPICDGDDLLLTSTSTSGTETYAWTGPNGFTSTNQNPTITGASTSADGNYIVTITDNGCSSTDNTTVVVNPIPTTTAGSNTPICDGDDLLLTASSSTGTETYAWTGPNGFSSTDQNPTITAASTLADGNYIVTITDNGCSSTDNTTVVVNAIPTTIAGSNSPICEGEDLLLTATSTSGTETYEWVDPNGNISNLQNPIITGTSTTSAGNYTVTVTDNGCSSTDNITVVVNAIPTTTAGSNSPICDGDDLFLTASSTSGTETYVWSGPNSFTSTNQNPSILGATPTESGTYSVTITDNGCSSTSTVDVNVISITSVSATSNTPICAGTTLQLTTDDIVGATYTWTGPNSFTASVYNPTITNSTTAATGTYSVTVSANGCSSSATTDVVVNAVPTTIAGSNSAICEGTDLNLTASSTTGTESYSWTGPNSFTSTVQSPAINSATTAATGQYIVTISENGCSSTATTDVIVNPIPTTTAGVNTPICAGSKLDFTADPFLNSVPNVSYSWEGPNNFSSNQQLPSIVSATTAATGTYTVTISANGCSSTSTIDAVVNPIPTTTASSNSPLCEGDDLNLDATPFTGASYSWVGPNNYSSTSQSPTITAASINETGTYTVTVSANGCSSTSSTDVVVNSIPVVIAGSNSAICEGQTLALTSNNNTGATFDWTGPNGFTSTSQNPSIQTSTLAASGTYTVTVTNNGCSASTTTDVVINPVPVINFTADDFDGCSPLTVNFTNNTVPGSNSVLWNFGDGSTSTTDGTVTHTFYNVGCYDITLTSETSGCSNSMTQSDMVCVLPDAIADFTANQMSSTLINPEFQFFNNSSNASIYSWSFGDGGTANTTNASHTYEAQPGTHTVQLIADNAGGCPDTAYLTIEIRDELIFYVPNTFTPDNDKFNQTFEPVFYSGYDPQTYTLLIFNRWGEVIFESHDIDVGWDGTYGGTLVQDGSYTWKITFNDSKTDETYQYLGHVNMLR
jgi:gliding motility-associated-like protein